MAPVSFAANLIEAYQDAVTSNPTYLAAKSTYLAALQNTPISRSVLLPQISITSNGQQGNALFLQKSKTAGGVVTNDTNTNRGYGVALKLSQSIFDFSSIAAFRAAKDTVKSAAETYYAAIQSLMNTVATDYFAVLQAQDNWRYALANTKANQSSLTQAQQQYRVGTNTLTDVYTAQAAYSSAVSNEVTAKTALENAVENLRAITGKKYTAFSALQDAFPLVSPEPKEMSDWVRVALEHNPELKAKNYTAMAAMKTVSAEFGGHLPTLTLNASYGTDYVHQVSNTAANTGAERTDDAVLGVDIEIPIFEGGLVTAQTKQAEYNYETAIHALELERRTIETRTREDYLSILSEISAIEADKIAVKSSQSALRGLTAGYRVGTQTMINVLNQQSLLLQAQQTYAADRYNYVTNFINLKNDLGVLNIHDLEAINAWLGTTPAVARDAQKAAHPLSHLEQT